MLFLVCQQICPLDGHGEQQLSSPSYETLAVIGSDPGIL